MRGCAAIFDPFLRLLDGFFERFGGKWAKDAPLAFFLLMPALVILGCFGIGPLFFALYISLFDLRTGRGPFVGLSNYVIALHNPEFWRSFFVTLYFAVGTIPVTLAISFVVATCLFRIARGRGLFRTVYFLPYVTSVVAAATVWRVILNPNFGLINITLRWLGLSDTSQLRWLLEPRGVLHLLTHGIVPPDAGPSLALCCVILFEIWHSSGFMIVVLLAGLAAIPRELEESARIDGANWYQLTRNVTIPLLSPTMFFLVVVGTIKSFQAFNSFYALTGDGSAGGTRNMTVYIYSNFYVFGKEGYGAAVATLLSLAIVVLTLVQWRVVGRRVYYE